jgi:outer membrane autotransporter protein
VGAAGTFNSGGLLNFVNGLTTDKLAITGTFAGAGNLNLDFNLANATVDQLAVTGSMAASAAQKVNVAFPGMPLTAHTSALFATVSGTSVAGNFVPGQMIGYNYAANFLDVGLTVSSVIDASNVAADKFSINVDVNGLNDTGTLAAAAATGAAGVMNTQMGTFRQRLGVNPYGDAGKVLSAFVRVYNEQGDMKPGHMAANFGQGGHFNYNQASWGREVGVNANLFENLHAGLVLGNADSRQRLTDGGMGENRLNGATVGGYVTWYVPGGFYVDFNARKMGADIRSTSAAGQLTSRSNTTAMSLEAGYEWNVGSFNLVPQAQFTHTKVEALKNFFGDRVNFEAHGGNFTRARLGVEMNKTFQMGDVRWTPYGSLNAVRDSSGKSSYTVGNFYGSTDMRGTSAMAEVGLGVQKGGLGFNIGASWTDGGAYKSFVGGQASVRFAW